MQDHLDHLIRNVHNLGHDDHNPQENGTMDRNLNRNLKTPATAEVKRGRQFAIRADAASLALAAVMLASGLQAATLDWAPAGGAGDNGDWDQTATNWYDSVADTNVAWNNATLDVAQFPSFTNASDDEITVTLQEAITAHRLVLAAGTGDVTLTGEKLTLNRNGVADPTALSVATGRTLLLESDVELTGAGSQWLSGTGLLHIDGDVSGNSRIRAGGTIRLSGDNSSHTGGWWTRTATLELASDTALGTGLVELGDRSGGTLTVRALNGTRTVGNNLTSQTRETEQIYIKTFDGNFVFTGNLQVNRSHVETSSINVFTVNTINGSTTFTGNVASTGAMKLDKRGAGTLAFDHATDASSSAFPAGVDIRAGTLLINSPFTGQGNYRVGGATITGDATLGGTGTISLASGNSVTVHGTEDYSATIAPGNSIGTLTINGDVIIGDYGVLSIEVSGAQSDLLVVDGDLNLSSLLNSLEIFGTLAGGEYIIASYSGTLFGEFANLPLLPSGYTLDYGTGSNSFITLAIPEPTSLAMLGLGTLALLKRRHHRA